MIAAGSVGSPRRGGEGGGGGGSGVCVPREPGLRCLCSVSVTLEVCPPEADVRYANAAINVLG